jgi:hypothetical protein
MGLKESRPGRSEPRPGLAINLAAIFRPRVLGEGVCGVPWLVQGLTPHVQPRRRRLSCSLEILRKEVIQPQVPLRLPCYDLVPIAEFIFGA